MANSRQKIKIRIIGNDEISREEGMAIWDAFFNIMRKKEIKENSSENKNTVGSEEIIKS